MERIKMSTDLTSINDLLGSLRQLITQARQEALRVVDAVQVRTCWEIGRYIVEFEQQGQARAEYGKGLLESELEMAFR